MSKIRIDEYSLRGLREKFENRDFAIPEIQRLYIWNKPRICNFMDSILRNYPIGISLVWNTPYSRALHVRPNQKTIIPPLNRRATSANLIIDGQQRLSTLYGVLFGVEPKPEADSYVNFKDLFFDCNKRAEKRFLFSKRYSEDTKGFIRLTTLLNTQPSVLRKRLHLRKGDAKEAEKCYRAFISYNFFVLAFDRLGYDDVREIFIRINSAGMTVNRADTLFARATSAGLRDHMLDTRRGLKHGFEWIPVDALQNTLALAYGSSRIGGRGFGPFLKAIDNRKQNEKEFPKQWKKLQFGYEEAVDFLVSRLGVSRYDLLPSQNIYSMLAYFFYLNQSRAKRSQTRELKKWFWHTSCGDRYSGAAFNRNIPDDIRFFRNLARSRQSKYHMSEKINPTDFMKTNYRNSKGSSSTNAYFILLRSKSPKYLYSGDEILLDDTSAISNRKDRHHIYPSALLKRSKSI